MKRKINIIKEERVHQKPLFFLTFNSVTISFNDNEPLFDNLDIVIPYGNILVIKGRVGTGKSTLLRSIAGVVHLNNGSIVNSTSVVHLNSGSIVNSAGVVHLDNGSIVNSADVVHLNSGSIVNSAGVVHLNNGSIVNSTGVVHLDSAKTVSSANGVHLGSSSIVDNDSTVDQNSNNDINILDSIYLHSAAEFNFVTGYLKDELILSSVLTDANSDISKFSEFIDRSIYDLSGGELKRLSIMIALEMGRDKVILLDEPLDMLDDRYASLISNEIIEMSKTTPFIIATHDTHFDDHADTIIEIVAS